MKPIQPSQHLETYCLKTIYKRKANEYLLTPDNTLHQKGKRRVGRNPENIQLSLWDIEREISLRIPSPLGLGVSIQGT
ncbi:hypothetical protein [Phormidium nigroviride]